MAQCKRKIPCFYCKSDGHKTENCDIYVTEESRQRILRSKYRCSQCTALLKLRKANGKHYVYCASHPKCYICFSKKHNTFSCSDNSAVSKLFPPKIDQILLIRFFKLLKMEEKYFLVFHFPAIFNAINLKPLKITYEKDVIFSNVARFYGSDIVVAYKCRIQRSKFQSIILSPLKLIIFRIENLEFYSFNAEIAANEFLQLLSHKTRTLKCGSTKFLPNLNLREIIKNAPYLEKLDLKRTEVEINYSWPEDLIRYNRASNMRGIDLLVSNFNFSIQGLANLMKTKCVKVLLCMHIFLDYSSDETLVTEMVKDRLSEHFVLKGYQPTLTIMLELHIGNMTRSEFVYFDIK